ncbi:hypothetical protein JW998_08990, partial [candidate division KSB1 bacterium]|nr:hypothetical protein [candidate division KSB1 bacterium]
MKRITLLLSLLALSTMPLPADGLLMPTDESYPKDLLRNRLTHVTVKINGLIAETEVYQEFDNEWDHAVDAVYSFPLPPDARATQFLYWADDKVFKAVLKVREQAINPGTGEGGIVAQVNEYIGRNGIKVALKNIPAGALQRVKLYYVSQCDFYAGETSYSFPLETGDFVTFPLDHLQFSILVNSTSPIKSFECPSHPEMILLKNDPHHLHVEIMRSKAFVARNFEFIFHTEQDEMGVDFYSVANDSMDGHFVLHVRPQNEAAATDVFRRRIIFAISNSSTMFGYKLDQSVKAIKSSLRQLSEADIFNIVLYNSSVILWKPTPVNASSVNIVAAEAFLDGISSAWGSRMDWALEQAIAQITDETYLNSI